MEGITLITKSTDINGCTHFDCFLEKSFTVKDFLEETRTVSKYITWYVQEKGQTVPIYTDGEKIVYVLYVNTNAIVKKAKASEFNGQYWFSINI
jgi:hypothetical protein